MDKSYMLNDYVEEKEKSKEESENSEKYLEQFYFRINGSRSMEELKRETENFLASNDLPSTLKEEIENALLSFTEDTKVYDASMVIENILKYYNIEKESKKEESSQEVEGIQNGFLTEKIDNLKEENIHVVGNIEEIQEKLNTEEDVYRLDKNVEKTTDYYQERNQTVDGILEPEVSIQEFGKAIDNPSNTTLLNSVLIEEEKKVSNNHSVTFLEDGTIQIDASKTNPDAMNFVAMMTLALVVGNNNLSLDTNMDMKFIKGEKQENSFQVIFGNFPLSVDGSTLDPGIIKKVQELSNDYQPNVSYKIMLATFSPEIKMALDIVDEQVLGKFGSFKMAMKENGSGHDIKFGMDQNYQDIIESFSEIGATAMEDLNHNITVLLPANQEQKVILSHVLESLRKKGYEEKEAQELVSQFQKKLVLDNTANVHGTFLTIIMITEIILVSLFFYLFIS